MALKKHMLVFCGSQQNCGPAFSRRLNKMERSSVEKIIFDFFSHSWRKSFINLVIVSMSDNLHAAAHCFLKSLTKLVGEEFLGPNDIFL